MASETCETLDGILREHRRLFVRWERQTLKKLDRMWTAPALRKPKDSPNGK